MSAIDPAPSATKAADDARLAAAFKDLEGAVCDLHAMALVLDTVLEDAMNQRLPRGSYINLVLTPDQETSLRFAATRMLTDIRDFRAGYYRSIEADAQLRAAA